MVDPGVGGTRKAIALKVDERWLVGPDNGLFDRMVASAGQVEWFEIDWRPENLSRSFHGRDLFAPVVAAIARGEQQSYLKPCVARPLRLIEPSLSKVIYIDGFGNCMTGILAKELAETHYLDVAGYKVDYAETFCQVGLGELFWYENALGLVEIAANQANAQQKLGICIGSAVIKV